MKPIPLRPRSRLARAVHRIMAGEPVTTLSVGPGAEAEFDVLCTVLSQLAAATPVPGYLRIVLPVAEAPADDMSSVVLQRALALQHALTDRGVASPSIGVPAAWGAVNLHVTTPGTLPMKVDLVPFPRVSNSNGQVADLLIVCDDPQHPLATASRTITSRQVLYVREHPEPRLDIRPLGPWVGLLCGHPEATWGPIPLEVLLAAGRG